MSPSRFGLLLIFVTCVSAWTTYTIPHTDGEDDTPAVTAALANHTSDATILFAKDTTYNIFTPITFPNLTNVEILIEGNITLPDNITTIQNIVGNSSFPGSWFTFTGGTNITLSGTTDPDWGWIDGHGQQWWDTLQQTNRPHAVAFAKIATGVIKNMKMWKPIGWVFSTSGSSNLHVYNNTVLAVSSTYSFPYNTDGFSAGGTDMLFENNHVENGDDCLTVGSGTKNIHFRNSYCANGHGLSIGSLGSGGSVADVQDVLIENIVVRNSLYGARFKSWTGGNGAARNVTWRNIVFSDVMFPIYVTQNYWDQDLGPKPSSSTVNNTHIEDFLFENFIGTIRDNGYVEGSCVSEPCWYAVTNATGHEVVVFDLYPNTATSITTKNIIASTESGAPVAALCDPATITSDVGFICQDGLFIPTAAGVFY